jgi:hypothetical protein
VLTERAQQRSGGWPTRHRSPTSAADTDRLKFMQVEGPRICGKEQGYAYL